MFRTRRRQFILSTVFLYPDPQNCTGSNSYLLLLAGSVAQQAKKQRAGLLLGGVDAIDGVNSFLIRFHKMNPEVFNYLLFLARSVAQQAEEQCAGLLLGGVGAVDGMELTLS